MRELWHNQLSCLKHEKNYYFNTSKGTLLEQEVISKEAIGERIFLKIFCNFAAA